MLLFTLKCEPSPVQIYSKWWLLIMAINRATSLAEFRSSLPERPVWHELGVATLVLTNSWSKWPSVFTTMTSPICINTFETISGGEVITSLWGDSSSVCRKSQGFQCITGASIRCIVIIQYMIISFPKSTGITPWRGNSYFPRGTNSQSGLGWGLSISRGWYRQRDVFGCLPDTEREGRENANFLEGQKLRLCSCRFMRPIPIDLIRDWYSSKLL